MKNLLFVIIIGVIILISGCNTTPVPMEFSNVCKIENDGKYLEVVGFLDQTGDLYCSGKQGEDMTCLGTVFKKDANIEIDTNKSIKRELNPAEIFTVYCFLRDSPNSLKKKEYKNFKKEDMEFIGNDNSIITIKDTVKITGKARIMDGFPLPGEKPYINCSITVDKIEKQ